MIDPWCNWQHVWFWSRRVQVRALAGQQKVKALNFGCFFLLILLKQKPTLGSSNGRNILKRKTQSAWLSSCPPLIPPTSGKKVPFFFWIQVQSVDFGTAPKPKNTGDPCFFTMKGTKDTAGITKFHEEDLSTLTQKKNHRVVERLPVVKGRTSVRQVSYMRTA